MSTGFSRWFSREIFWKEYRQMRAFWLAMAILTVLLELLVYASTAGTNTTALFAVGIGFPAFYALGCGATMFAAERESGTYEFLRSLPASGLTTLLSKAALALVSTPLLFAATWSAAMLISGFRLPDAALHREIWLLWGVGSIELLVWSVLFSLLLEHPMKAAIFGAMGASFSVHLLCAKGYPAFMSMTPYAEALPWRIALALVVAAADVWLGSRWFRETRTGRLSDDRKPMPEAGAADRAAEWESFSLRSSALARLLWLQWRQSSGMALVLTVLCAPLVIVELVYGIGATFRAAWGATGPSFGSFIRGNENMAFYYLMALAAVPLAGVGAFAGDQRLRRFRFLAERGISARAVWWSRHLVWFGVLFVWGIAALAAFLLAALSDRNPPADRAAALVWIPIGVAAYGLVAYSIGQFCSMLFSSGILAGTLALAGALLLSAWSGAMIGLSVNPLWSIAPIPLVLLVATRLRTAGWMHERNTIASWAPSVLLVAVSAAAIVTGVCFHRAYEIPAVDPGFSVAEATAPASAEAIETANLYRRAHDMMTALDVPTGAVSSGSEIVQIEDRKESPEQLQTRYDRWTDANRETIALAMEASRRPECDGCDRSFTRTPLTMIGGDLADLLIRKGMRLEKAGDLDGAAEYYLAVFRIARHVQTRSEWPYGMDGTERFALTALVDWSKAEGQTSQRILGANHVLEELTSALPPYESQLYMRHIRTLGWIDGDMAGMLQWLGKDPKESIPVLALYWLPWERTRAHRALDRYTSQQLALYNRTKRALEQGTPVVLPPRYGRSQPKWLSTTPIMWACWDDGVMLSEFLVHRELRSRAARLQLALKAWKLDHAGLPETLDPLKGSCLARIPVEPLSGEPFVYFPKGLATPIERLAGATGEVSVVVKAGEPFFWSPWPDVQVIKDGPPLRKYLIGSRWEPLRPPATEQEIWAHGQVFLVP